MEGDITLNAMEQRRLLVLNQLELGVLTNDEAGELLQLSVRQVRRLRSRYSLDGAAALAHGNRGRPPVNAVTEEVRRRVVELATGQYQGFNQQHLTEKLAEEHGIRLSRPTVHRLLKAAGVAAPRRRRPPKHRRRRDRFPQAGMLLQIDASRHDWLEGRGPYLSLVGAIDDATNRVTAAEFRLQEDAEGYFRVLRRTVVAQGVPLAIYSDRHGIFFRTKNNELSFEEQLQGRRHPTQFGRLLEELGVRQVLARSPQGKGRVERLWGTFQDRLTSELRLARASSLKEANQVLRRFLPRHNRQFTVAPSDPAPAWRPAPAQLDHLFCFKYMRRVAADHTVHFDGHVLDLAVSRTSYAGRLVEVQQRFDGTLQVFFGELRLARIRSTTDAGQPQRVSHYHPPSSAEFVNMPTKEPKVPRPRPAPPVHTPAANHPWRSAAWAAAVNRS